MRAAFDAWPYVIAAYGVALGATIALVAWSLWTMKRAEARRDKIKRRR
ncbi:heme exporter protein CcmD [Novosphingobium sp. 9]|nr:heme exporter protein CcmD [Novosphingobium sp. 9]